MALDYEAPQTVYSNFDPTSLFAGDYHLMNRKITLASGLNSSGTPLAMGTLLGEVTNAGAYSAAAAAHAGITGGGSVAMGTPATLANVQIGVYRIVWSSATAFQVYDPKGDEIGTGVNGTAFATQVKFTATASGAAFVSGDEWDVTVTEAAEQPYSSASAAGGSNVGNGTLALASPAALLYAQAGAYTVTFDTATTFHVTDPLGNPVGAEGATGVAFATQVGFTITAGGTAFAAGDTFTITLSAQNLFKTCVQTATDGSQNPICVLAQFVDTSGGAVSCQAWFTGEFAYEQMNIDSSWTLEQLNQALIASGRDLFIRSVGLAS